MKNKNVFKLTAIIFVVVGFFLISLSFILGNKSNKELSSVEDNDSDKTNVDENNGSAVTYADVYRMAISLYSGDDVDVAVEEESDRFVIKRIHKSTGKTEFYYVDKATGELYTNNPVVEG